MEYKPGTLRSGDPKNRRSVTDPPCHLGKSSWAHDTQVREYRTQTKQQRLTLGRNKKPPNAPHNTQLGEQGRDIGP